ncbi:MAG: 30S ribosomal protein S19e [Candidatus Parvarchaeota archaeon]|jgi:small subunit ribosomal protein S19e|nr:30S ribosomal protein S19e [Candidatus Parvarchaeota archaeon]MCL5018063.1 30S ribosomal protein S19e [Candidatus Parvarchaeota archaeon]
MIRGYDVDQIKLTSALAEDLKKEKILEPTPWSKFVKTGSSKDRIPQQEDWWYLRGASILRRMYIDKQPIGVNRLRSVYGDKEKNRYSGRHFKPASGAIIRKIMQQLEKAELIKKVKIEKHYGRKITGKGVALIDRAAKSLEK